MSQALSQALQQTRCVQHSLSEYLHYIFKELLIKPVRDVGGSEWCQRGGERQHEGEDEAGGAWWAGLRHCQLSPPRP